MSASLVGSEMCIRDRDSRTQPEAALVPALSPSREVSHLCPKAGRLTSPCLLYTSDAADDM
eukprot:12596597-Alexandrium_andersonii.AAC.1